MNLTQRSTFLAAFAALGAFLLSARPVHAQSLITIGNVVSAAPGGSGSFDVLLTAVNGPLSIGSFSVEPFLSGSGVTFTAADFNTVTPYIFPDSFDQAIGSPLTNETTDPFPNADLIASDSDNQTDGAVTITSGSTVGLAHVTYLFDAADTPGSVYTVDFNPDGTSLSDGTGKVSYPVTTVPGALTVGASASAAPEPSGWAAMGFAGLFAAGLMLRAHRRKTAVPDVVTPLCPSLRW